MTVTVTPTTGAVASSPTATAVVRDQNGNVMVNAGSWSVSSGPGTINPSGVITPIGPGPIIVQYTQGSASGVGSFMATSVASVATTAVVTLTPNSVIETQPSVAGVVVRDQNGDIMPAAGAWSIVSGPGTVSVDGQVFTTGPGTVVVRYTQGAAVGSANLTVTAIAPPPPPASVPNSAIVSISPSSLAAGESANATVTILDQNNLPMSGVAGTWSVQSGVGTINPSTGAITTTIATTLTVRFTVQQNGVFDDASITVTSTAPPPPPTAVPNSVVITLTPATVTSGLTSQATAAVRDQFNNPIGATIQWSITSGPATINSSGQVSTLGTGSVVVRADVSGYPGVFDTEILQVNTLPPPPGPTPLYSIVFAGKNVLALPGCRPISSANAFRSGKITGAVFSTKKDASPSSHLNTSQTLTTPIAGVRRIVLKNARVRDGVAGAYLNDKVVTNTLKQFIRAIGPSNIIIGSFTVNASPTDITIDFGITQTISTLFGNGTTAPNTMHIEMEGLELWATPA